MVRLELSTTALSSLRFRANPLWETVCALALLRLPQPSPYPYRAWSMEVARHEDNEAVGRLVSWVKSWQSPHVPPLLLPAPEAEVGDFDSELSRLSSTSSDELLDGLTTGGYSSEPGFELWARRPRQALEQFCDDLDVFWRRAMQPRWPRIAAALDTDILLRGKAIADNGVDGLLTELHPRLHWGPPILDVVTSAQAAWPQRVDALVLVPSLFCREAVFLSRRTDTTRALCYQALGAGSLIDAGSRDEGSRLSRGRLAGVLGETRAALCLELRRPSTTTALATQFGLSASTVSEHIANLRRIDLVSRRRVGLQVYYELTDRGRAIVSTCLTN